MTVVVRRPAPPLDGLVTAIMYRAGEQSRTSVEKILPGPEDFLLRQMTGALGPDPAVIAASGPG